MKKGFIIAFAVLTTLGLAIFTGAFVASGFDFSKFDAAKYETKVYSVEENFNDIEIDATKADITFKPSENGQFSAVCVERENVGFTFSVENRTLKVTENDTQAWYEYLMLSFKSVSVTLYLPSNDYRALKVENGTGHVTIPDCFSFESIDITTSTGDITLEGINAKTIDLSVSTGNIDVVSVTCKTTLKAKASTGNIVLKNTVASDGFGIETSTGNVRFENCDAANIKIKTSTGNVTGTLRSAKIFVAKTSTGSVSVPDTTSGGNCEITTSTGNINIKISE